MRGPIGLDGREYKLLLDASGFAGAPSEKAAKAFWTRRLKPIIEKHLDAKASGKTRAKGELKLEKQRLVAFLDTKRGLLDRQNFSLRLRTRLAGDDSSSVPEVTLKFRTPDFLLAAEYFRAAREHDPETKLEEDIAPLQVAREGKQVAVPTPRSVYSRFSVSTKLLAFGGTFATLGDVFDQFGALQESLDRDGKAAADTKLVSGPTICEWVFEDAEVDLGEELDAGFSFTLWYVLEAGETRDPWKHVASGAVDPRIAEISFDFDTKNGRMDKAAAERASKLFIAMQMELPVDKEATSKTALGLPADA